MFLPTPLIDLNLFNECTAALALAKDFLATGFPMQNRSLFYPHPFYRASTLSARWIYNFYLLGYTVFETTRHFAPFSKASRYFSLQLAQKICQSKQNSTYIHRPFPASASCFCATSCNRSEREMFLLEKCAFITHYTF